MIVTDTAGVRPTEDPIELEGIRRSEGHARAADLTVLVLDASEERERGGGKGGEGGQRERRLLSSMLPDWALGTGAGAGRHLTVLNKVDLVSGGGGGGGGGGVGLRLLPVSCVTQEGVDEFVAALQAAVEARVTGSGEDGTGGSGGGGGHDRVAITRLRHRHRLEECVLHLTRFAGAAANGHELAAEELRLAARALGHVTGHVVRWCRLNLSNSS